MEEEKKEIRISLKTSLIILCFIIVVIIGLVLFLTHSSKEEIYDEEINSIDLSYYEGYNIATGDLIKNTIPLNKIELKGNDLNEISKLIKSLKTVSYSKDSEMYEHIKYDNIFDDYKLVVNNYYTIYIGCNYGLLDKEYEYFESKEIYNKISEIVKKYNEDNLYKTINSDKITIINGEEKLEVTDLEQLEELSNYNYYVINASDKSFNDEEVAFILNLYDGRTIDVFYASVLSCIHYEDGTKEYIYTGNLENCVERIFNNSKVKMYTNDVEAIKVTYKNSEHIIDDKSKVEELLKEFKKFEYNDFASLKNMDESDFDENDIWIYVGDGKYIIPGHSYWASRFYIDEDGKVYDVSGLYNNELEEYFKNLVNYKK